jgi:hypothetical protein
MSVGSVLVQSGSGYGDVLGVGEGGMNMYVDVGDPDDILLLEREPCPSMDRLP